MLKALINNAHKLIITQDGIVLFAPYPVKVFFVQSGISRLGTNIMPEIALFS